MYIQVVDRKRYVPYDGLDKTSPEIKFDKKKWKQAVRQFTEKYQMPILWLYHQNSIVQNANFGIINDDKVKSIFMLRPYEKTRGQITTDDPSRNNVSLQPGPMATMFRSSIKGDVTMLGNFCFEVFGTLWVQFGIWAFDGIFYIRSEEHTSELQSH